jgi:AcrR family transcriptional regulator
LTGVLLRSITPSMSSRDPKQVILDAALSVFVELGFDRASTGHILARAGISNGALFHHFSSKDAIAEALYLQGMTSYQRGLVQALERHRGTKSARAAVRAAVHHHLAWVEANEDLALFMYERGRPDWQPAHGSAVRQVNRATARHVRDWMTPYVEAGMMRDLPLTVLAAFVNGPAHFIARRWLSGLITARPTSFSDVLADAAWAAIALHRPRPSAPPPARVSLAARIEAAALDAARGTSVAASGAWTILQLTMNRSSEAPGSATDSARIEAIKPEAGGRVAMVDVALVDADGDITVRGHAVCVWQDVEARTSEGRAAAR